MEIRSTIPGNTHYATFATVKDAIVQYVQKNYKGGHDIAQSLIQGSKITLTAPVRTRAMPASTAEADIEAAKFAQEGHDILYTEQMRLHQEWDRDLTDGLKWTYALIFSNFYTKAM